MAFQSFPAERCGWDIHARELRLPFDRVEFSLEEAGLQAKREPRLRILTDDELPANRERVRDGVIIVDKFLQAEARADGYLQGMATLE